MSFQERFKSKFSVIGKHGEINIKSEQAIIKPAQSQIHSPVMRGLAKAILDSKPKSPSTTRPDSSKNPVDHRRIESQSPSVPVYLPKPRTVTFRPYSLHDYYLIKPTKYYVLGGVGPASVGTEDWTIRKQIIDKRTRYGQEVNKANVKRVSKSTEFYSNRGALLQ